MTHRPSDDERILAILDEARRAPLPSSSSLDRNDARDDERRLVQWLAQLIQRGPSDAVRHTTNRRRVIAGVAAFAAAAAAILFHVAIPSDAPKPTVAVAAVPDPSSLVIRQVVGNVVATRADGRDLLLSAGMELSKGDEISTTAESFASLELEAGIRVDLAAATTLGVTSPQVIDLRIGRVDVNVPKIPGVSKRLSVGTPDTRVVVRGTIFSVEVDAAGPALRTRVGVTRGAVSVEHEGRERVIEAGELWSSQKPLETEDLLEGGDSAARVANPGPAPKPEVEQTPEPGPPAVVRTHKRRPAPPSATPEDKVTEPEPSRSSLTRQNRIFERGLRARDQKDDRRAVYWFDQLLRRYPDTPLAESAERERAAARARLAGD